jgi:hypothetical protein
MSEPLTITLRLPAVLMQRAQLSAQVLHRPIEDVLTESLSHVLPPLEDLPEAEALELASLALLADGALWREARETFSVVEQAELEELLYQQNAGLLSREQAARLQDLLAEAGRLMVRKSYAYLLLARRGYQVPMSGKTH